MENINPISEYPSFEVVSEIAEETTKETNENGNGYFLDIKEEYKPYYEEYYELIKNYSSINQPEDILLKMNNIFKEKYEKYSNIVAHDSADLTQTMYSNFIIPDETVLKSTPLS